MVGQHRRSTTSTNKNYFSGFNSSSVTEDRDYFVFDLSSVSQTIAGAQLSLNNPSNGYIGTATSMTYTNYEVSTPISTLEGSGSGQIGIFNGLGSGTSVATTTVSAANDGQNVLIPLNSAGIGYVNAARGTQVAVGGAVTPIIGTTDQGIFGYTSTTNLNSLVLTYAAAQTSDWYSVNVTAAGNTLNLFTTTPSDGSGEFVNTLSPHIQLYDPTGTTLLASGTVGADGRNETLGYAVTAAGAYKVRITSKNNTQGEYFLSVVPASVAGRSIFYNNSYFDGNNPAANSQDDAAIATDKTPLLPGGTASFANYTSYSRGINGIMIDVQNLSGTPTAADFVFKVGNSNTPGTWTAAPAPTSVTVRPGPGGASRIEVVWPDGAISKEWLQVTLLADAATGLAANDVSYWGNAVGDTGNSPTDTYVNATDEILTRHNSTASAAITNVEDFDRSGTVDANDVNIVRQNGTNFLTALKFITVPVTSGASQLGPGATTTVLTTSAATAVLGMPPAFTAVVTPSDSSAMPTGQVDFVDSTTGTDLGLALLDAAGQAVLSAPALAFGTHGIVAVYSGDANFSGSASTPSTVTVLNSATWFGGGPDANWSTAANWGGMTLAAGMPLSFTGAGGPVTNDLTAMQVGGIAFPAESGPFVLGGNAVSLSGVISNAASAMETVALPITLVGGDAVLNSDSGILNITGDIASGGAYGIQKTGAGTVVLAGNNTYTGNTTVADGKLVITTDTALPSGTDITVGNWGDFGPAASQSGASLSDGVWQLVASTKSPAQTAAAISVASAPASADVAVAAALPQPPRVSVAEQVFAAMAPSSLSASDSAGKMRAAAAILADSLQANSDATSGDALARRRALDAVLADWS